MGEKVVAIRHLMLAGVAMMVLAGCAQPQAPAASRDQTSSPQASGPKGTLKIAWGREPESLSPKFLGGSGNGEFQWTFNSALTVRDFTGTPRPLLAREIPTRDNGDWVINPDGTMITTYRLNPSARWHDSTPITAGDYAFAYQVYLDKDLPIQQPSPEPLMASVTATDDLTVVVRWKEPFLNANTLGFQQLIPLPRQVLEEKYRSNRAAFPTGEEWTTAYIGTGPFRVERWTPGVGIIARAHSGWALGPPKLDVIDIRFIIDGNAQIANLLAGEVDMINSPAVRAPEAGIIREQWGENAPGYIKAWVTRTAYLEFQFREVANWQRAVTDVRVRRALLHSIDRAGLADVINLGFAPQAEAFVAPTDPLFPEVDSAIMKYPFDRNRSAQLLAEAGWVRPTSGGLATDAAGRTLNVEVWATASQDEEGTIVSDNFRGVGVNANPYVIPAARARDGELRSSFPAAGLNGRTIGADTFVWTTENFPGPENRWQGSNRGSFADPEVDRLQKIRLTSADPNENKTATIALLRRMSELIGAVPLIYSVEVIIARNRVKGPVGNYGPQEGITWNIYEWEVTD
jgi:peptide/nickel transport system substrate-binding protein